MSAPRDPVDRVGDAIDRAIRQELADADRRVGRVGDALDAAVGARVARRRRRSRYRVAAAIALATVTITVVAAYGYLDGWFERARSDIATNVDKDLPPSQRLRPRVSKLRLVAATPTTRIYAAPAARGYRCLQIEFADGAERTSCDPRHSEAFTAFGHRNPTSVTVYGSARPFATVRLLTSNHSTTTRAGRSGAYAVDIAAPHGQITAVEIDRHGQAEERIVVLIL